MSLGFSHKDQILLHEGVKSKRRKYIDPDKAGEQNYSFQSLVAPRQFSRYLFLGLWLYIFWYCLQNFSLWSQTFTQRGEIRIGKKVER